MYNHGGGNPMWRVLQHGDVPVQANSASRAVPVTWYRLLWAGDSSNHSVIQPKGLQLPTCAHWENGPPHEWWVVSHVWDTWGRGTGGRSGRRWREREPRGLFFKTWEEAVHYLRAPTGEDSDGENTDDEGEEAGKGNNVKRDRGDKRGGQGGEVEN